MSNLLSNKILWGVVITFLVSGLGSITGLVSPSVAAWVAIIVNGLTAIGHTYNLTGTATTG